MGASSQWNRPPLPDVSSAPTRLPEGCFSILRGRGRGSSLTGASGGACPSHYPIAHQSCPTLSSTPRPPTTVSGLRLPFCSPPPPRPGPGGEGGVLSRSNARALPTPPPLPRATHRSSSPSGVRPVLAILSRSSLGSRSAFPLLCQPRCPPPSIPSNSSCPQLLSFSPIPCLLCPRPPATLGQAPFPGVPERPPPS